MKKADFRNSIRRIRVEKKMTLAEVSEMVGVSIAYLSDIERGNRHGSETIRQKIADSLGVPVTEFIEKEAG